MTHGRLINLTRRQLLVETGAVGLAAAGTGLGTSALFSDRESFEDNVITAGTLDLLVHYESEYNGAPATNLARNPSGVVDGEPGLFYTLDDVKPGDSGWFQFCFELNTNPAYQWVCTAQTDDAENGQTEPEIDAEGTDTDGLGELDDEIIVDAYYAEADGTPIAGGELASGVTLASTLAAFENGRALNADATDETPGDQTPYAPSSALGELTGPCIRFDWALPAAVGNEVQSDTLAFGINFHAIQARNTDGTDNPCADGTSEGTAKTFSSPCHRPPISVTVTAAGGSPVMRPPALHRSSTSGVIRGRISSATTPSPAASGTSTRQRRSSATSPRSRAGALRTTSNSPRGRTSSSPTISC
jgi:predicted ribosomally synthesized peptide with SipW-like signal peptide